MFYGIKFDSYGHQNSLSQKRLNSNFCKCLINIEIYFAGLAQLVEQLICNQQVGGSKPLASFLILLEAKKEP